MMMADQAFTGLKVADFAWIGVGPISMKYLADHGATVVHVESSTRPDGLRMAPPFKDGTPGIDRSQFFANYNSSKMSLALNMSQPAARAIARRLVGWADVVAESYSPKAMKAWGLDYESIREFRPDIVMLSTCQMGQTGPWAMFPGAGHTGGSMAGYYHITGWPDGDPGYVYGAYTDFLSPRLAIAAVLAALDHRRRTGEGQYIDQSQIESGIQFQGPAIMEKTVNGRVWGRNGNRSPWAAPHGAFRCAGDDRWVAIAVRTDAEWCALTRAMGEPEWTRDRRFATLLGRKAHEDDLERNIEGWTCGQDAHEVMRRLQAEGVPAGAVQKVSDLFSDPQLAHRGHFRTLNHTEMGAVAYDGPSFRLSRTPDQQRAAPCLGEHTEYVCREILAMPKEEYQELAKAGVFV
ncbi:MAG: CoA transferase [Chloroflexi bacterium]|nr:CoA transferase [Chloroflexota bacterium]